uniref:Uncharacterized protein n=1 Tax=Tetradesmus obliquus TaxID=3088 RepID=A0A383W2L2_TETOB|eukprot:jgi/Sobl393_1/10204/SZX71721.1
MFKLSLLQAASGKQQQQQCQISDKHQRSTRQQAAGGQLQQQQQQEPASLLSTALQPRSWSLQAAAVTDNLGCDAARFKSLAVYAEVKLAEALEKAAKALPDAFDEDGELLPNSLKTAVCCQLLGELAELCGPFSSTLLRLRDELLPAVYSSYAATQTGTILAFDQMPWFAVAGQLQEQNHALLQQQEAIKAELGRHQAQMVAVEQQLLAFKAAMDAGEAAASKLQVANAGLIAARDSTLEEAAAAADEIKRLAAEVARLKDELAESQEQLSNAKEVAAQDMEQWQGQLEAFKKQLHVEKQQGEAAVELAAARLTIAEGQELEARCQEAERRLEEAEQQLAALAAASSSTELQQQQQLTPRPTEWGDAQALAEKCKATSETVKQLLQQHAATVSAMKRQLQLLQAACLPDPAPQPWRLNVRTEASSYFITEGALNPSDEGSGLSNPSKPKTFAEPLGLGPSVPRFLRRDESVELAEVALQELLQQVSSIWQGKAAHEELHGPCHLQEYVYHRCMEAASAAASAGVPQHVTVGDGRGLQGSSSQETAELHHSSTTDKPAEAAAAATAAAAAAAAAGYQLYHALSQHRHASVAVDTMWQVLTGQLPESVLLEQQRQLQQLLAVMEELQHAATASDAAAEADMGTAETAADGEGMEAATRLSAAGLRMSDMQAALRLLYPFKRQQQLADLAACLEAACAGSSAGASSARSTGPGGSLIQAEGLAAVVKALQQAAGSIGIGILQQQEGTPEPSAAAAAAVVECVLRQHLQEVLSHTQHTLQQVQQLLEHPAVSAFAVDAIQIQPDTEQRSPADEGKLWQQLAAVLAANCSCNSIASNSGKPGLGSRQSSMNARQQPAAAESVAELGSRLGRGGSGRYGSSTGNIAATGVGEMPLIAAASACRTLQAGGSSSHSWRGDTPGTAAAATVGGPDPASNSHACNCYVHGWLSAAQRCKAGSSNSSSRPDVQQLLCWLQRECLLQPPSCQQDAASALRWCRTIVRH